MRFSRRLFAVEVVQTSTLDCGPAALKCLLESFGIPVSYGRLREACQTGLDGTSIDTMELVANQMGLEAEQITIPVDHLILKEAGALPALVVVQLPGGVTHFVVVWRRHGNFLQVMDPSVGRRWISCDRFLRDVYRHTIVVPAEGWREFTLSTEFQAALRKQLTDLRIPADYIERLCSEAISEQRSNGLSTLDAATRLVKALCVAGALTTPAERLRVLEEFCKTPELVPDRYWSARPALSDSDGIEQVAVRGAILVRARGRKPTPSPQPDRTPELAAAMNEAPPRPGRELLRYLFCGSSKGSFFLLLVFGCTLLAAGFGVLVEALLFRSLFDLATELHLRGQRLGAAAAILIFSGVLLVFELALFSTCVRLGRQLELRLRIAFLRKIPSLGDRYFQSRLTSDMAERSHASHRMRNLPDLCHQLLAAVFKVIAMAGGLIWLQPAGWPIVLGIVAAACVPPLLSQPILTERDLRVRTHTAGLTRFYLDAMLGLLPIRAHSGARHIRDEQEKTLGNWGAATLSLQKTVTLLEVGQLTAMFALTALLLLAHPLQTADTGRVLLIIYWALNLPVLGLQIGALARQYPGYRNVALRIMEPLGAPEEPVRPVEHSPSFSPPSLQFRGVSAQVSGHSILHDISVDIHSGAHIAVVGPSGAGKSSLASLLLGWLSPSKGHLLVNGLPHNVDELRRSIAWVDPSVQLWNRSLLDNVRYGSEENAPFGSEIIDAAHLRSLLETLPEGWQTRLGESGALVSGGEGQRVRLARAMLHRDAGLVILDEPFRGLDRARRRELLARARQWWSRSTLLCITHDIAETESFDRVLVIENGSITEDGAPWDLRQNASSRYSQLLAAEHRVRSQLWSTRLWRRVRVENGRAVETIQEVAAHEGAEVA